ncbi:efflux RND transporter permease subunit [Thalassotalea sp. LPB0316]|uniref:efflux RND transporter permease subunit n=1 Tax=Thalassotalea sp. LPB0316 TaxID=2769490 RepID=UPI00186952C0|nr:efflux RND transporter permease subunit [Thalassotalea sp. LPB0316]QOL25318.1 efflux RND transporter permease subunit [Thalassotalea sp. LPB0316]
MDIARYSIKNPVNIWLLVLICVIGGVVGLSNIGRLEDPAFTIKQARVMTYFPGASAEQVELEITERIEVAIQQMPQLKRVTSISKPGMSEVTVEIKDSYKSSTLPQIWDELRKRLRDARAQLPLGASEPQILDDFGDVFGLYYALTAPDFSLDEIREFSRIIRRELLTAQGVAKVDVNGLRSQQIVAYMDPYRIAGLGLSFPDVIALFNDNLQPFDSGRVEVDGKKLRLLVEDAESRIDSLSNLTLVLPGSSSSIKIRDIAELRLEESEVQNFLVNHNGQEAVTLSVSAISDVNIVSVGEQVDEKIAQVLAKLPAGIELTPIYNQAKIVDQAVEGFIENLIMSVVVVTVTLCLFMGWRSGVVVGSVLLITVMGTVLIMWLLNLQLQRISLGAMVIAMGMLVDNAIVVAEGMMLRMKQGKSAIDAASFIVKRTQWPLLGATVIGIAAFSGIGLSNDSTGEFLFSLFAVVLISLMLSWVLAVSVTPLFGSYFYRVEKQADTQQKISGFLKGYLGLLNISLRHRWLTVGLLVVITISAYAGFSKVKQGFFPASNTPLFFIHYWGSQDNDIRQTHDAILTVEKALLRHDKVTAITSFIGRGADRYTLTYSPQAPNESYGLLLVRMANTDDIDQYASDILAKAKAANLDADFYLERLQFGPGGGAKLAVRFSGPDNDVLRDLANQAMTIMRADGEIRDIRQNWRQKGLALNTHFDEYNAGIAGVSRTDFTRAVQYASTGVRLGVLQDGDYAYPIVAKMSASQDSVIGAIENNQVWSQQQRQYIPFKQLSSGVTLVSEEVLIQRRDRIRTITVFADPAFGETANKALLRVKTKIEAIPLPDGYNIEWGGEYESSKNAQKALGSGLPAGFLVMFLVSVLLFGKLKQPLIIWLVVPMAVVGVVSGLLLADMPFGFMSLLGFLSLFGMLIKNAIVLIEEIDLQIAEGSPPNMAVVEASVSRLRPVSLAAITTILGMAPLLFDAFFADMAVTIMGGLTFATLLTLVAVPVLYSLFFKIKVR